MALFKTTMKNTHVLLLVLAILLICLIWQISRKSGTDILIVITRDGRSYASKIRKELQNLNPKLKIRTIVNHDLEKYYKAVEHQPALYPKLIISRTAHATNTGWLKVLYKLEKRGVKVINPPDVLQLTSNKLECSLKLLSNNINHPNSIVGYKNKESTILDVEDMLRNYGKLIIKPYTSQGQGVYVKVITHVNDIRYAISTMPTDSFVVQEFVPYVALYRIIVIDNKALPLAFMDVPTKNRWKVSVCLNKNMKFIANPDPKLLKLGEDIQKVIMDGGVHFIDIFKLEDGSFTTSEINTACSLNIHEKKAHEHNHKYRKISKHIANYYYKLFLHS